MKIIQILRGSRMDPYILNKRPDDPSDGGKINITSGGLFVQTLDEYLKDFVPDEKAERENYGEKVKLRSIVTIELGIGRYKVNLDNRVNKLYLPAIEKGSIPDDNSYKQDVERLRFEDEERFEKFFTRAIKKALTLIERNAENEAIFKAIENMTSEKLYEFLSELSEEDKAILIKGITKNLDNAQLRIEELYKPAIKQGKIPNTPSYTQRITELGIEGIDDLRVKLFYFLRNALCLTNWNDDDALRTDERAFASCVD